VKGASSRGVPAWWTGDLCWRMSSEFIKNSFAAVLPSFHLGHAVWSRLLRRSSGAPPAFLR
jgi:hypothetical protein